MKIRVIKGDITRLTDVEVIVNAANPSLLGGGGVDGAIHRAAGPALLEECRSLNGCKTGEAKITKGYKLPCKYVIHTVGPVWKGGTCGEAELLASCYINSLKLAEQYGIRAIAFPSISTGAYSYPLEQAADVAAQAVTAFLKDHPRQFDLVEWVAFGNRSKEAYKNALRKYIGEEYIN